MAKKTQTLGKTANGSVQIQLDAQGGKLGGDIGIELPDGRAHTVVKRGKKFPIHHEQVFSTASSYQTAVEFHVVCGTRPLAKDNQTLARIRLRNIKWAAAGTPMLAVFFDIDETGLLTISVDNMDRKDEAIIETGEAAARPAGEKEAKGSGKGEPDEPEPDDEEQRARIAALDEARDLLRDANEMYFIGKRKMSWFEKRAYKRVRKQILEVADKTLLETTRADMDRLNAAVQELNEQGPMLRERKRQVEAWYR